MRSVVCCVLLCALGTGGLVHAQTVVTLTQHARVIEGRWVMENEASDATLQRLAQEGVTLAYAVGGSMAYCHPQRPASPENVAETVAEPGVVQTILAVCTALTCPGAGTGTITTVDLLMPAVVTNLPPVEE